MNSVRVIGLPSFGRSSRCVSPVVDRSASAHAAVDRVSRQRQRFAAGQPSATASPGANVVARSTSAPAPGGRRASAVAIAELGLIAEIDAVVDAAARSAQSRFAAAPALPPRQSRITSGRTAIRPARAVASMDARCGESGARRCMTAIEARCWRRRSAPLTTSPARKFDFADEVGDIAVDRRVVELARRAELHDAAVAHDGDGVAHARAPLPGRGSPGRR